MNVIQDDDNQTKSQLLIPVTPTGSETCKGYHKYNKATSTKLTPAANITLSLVQIPSSVTVAAVAVAINIYLSRVYFILPDLFTHLGLTVVSLFVANKATCEYNLSNTKTLQM